MAAGAHSAEEREREREREGGKERPGFRRSPASRQSGNIVVRETSRRELENSSVRETRSRLANQRISPQPEKFVQRCSLVQG